MVVCSYNEDSKFKPIQLRINKKEYDEVDKYCNEKPLEWTMSVWDLESLDFSKAYDLPFLKIPSA